jgi:predicted metal-dependent hydrolase
MEGSVTFGRKEIGFRVQYSDRTTLGITVMPDMEVVARAPLAATMEQVTAFVKKKAAWILKQQRFFLTYHPKTPARRYVGGETHLYMGRQYRLKVMDGNSDSVRLKGSFIEVSTDDRTKVKDLMDAWYAQHAQERLHAIATPLIERFRRHGVEPSSVLLKHMPTRWGSCTAKGKVILNPELIKAPRGCIEYVIVHELCHLIHHDHTQRFVDFQTKEMPDWERWKGKLEKVMA